MALFEKGQPGKGGRRKGSRDRISTALLEAIAKDFEEFGEEAVKIARVEKPVEYLRIVASLLPKEFEIVDSRLHDITDEELDASLLRADLRSRNGRRRRSAPSCINRSNAQATAR